MVAGLRRGVGGPSCLSVLPLPPFALQLNLFLALSASLRQMAATQWPGFTDQGVWLIQDLTQSAVVLGQQSMLVGMYAPYSYAGFLLPFALLWMYRKTTQESPLGACGIRSKGTRGGE